MIKRDLHVNNIPYEADNLSHCFHKICRPGNGIGFTQFLLKRDFTENLRNKIIYEKKRYFY